MSVRRYKNRAPSGERHYVHNMSKRLFGGPIQAIAVHSTESQDLKGTKDDLLSIRNWFNNPASDASSHIGIDGQGNTEIWVPYELKAWTILQLNSVTLNIEFIGRASQSARDWEEAQIKQGARWAAYWCLRAGIPAQRGGLRSINNFPVVSKKGIIRHKDLTDIGFGTHQDPGPKFPMREFIDATQWYKKNGWTL